MVQLFSSSSLIKSQDKQAHAALDSLPVAVMTCDAKTLVIDYANKASMELLKKIEHLLDISADEIVGTSIDRFHKHPEHQRTLLSDPRNLPHRAVISLGEEYLELDITPIFDSNGKYVRASLVWNIVTDKVRGERETKRLMQMIDKMPINVMTCDPETFEINYMNQTSIDTLRKVETYLPAKADELLGKSIDIFHKNPAHQQAIVGDPSRLPWKANIKVGPETLRLDINAIMSEGTYVGPMLTWSIITQQITVSEKIQDGISKVSDMSAELSDTAAKIVEISEDAEQQSVGVTSATEEMSASILEISNRMEKALEIATQASQQAGSTGSQIEILKTASDQINSVMDTIQGIADQTKLLALNATIEAARAGEAGKGFHIVAAEVKNLSEQTSAETEQIRQQIETMQRETQTAQEAVTTIGSIIETLNEHSVAVASSMTEQQAAAEEIARSMSHISKINSEVRTYVQTMNTAAEDVERVQKDNSEVIEEMLSHQ